MSKKGGEPPGMSASYTFKIAWIYYIIIYSLEKPHSENFVVFFSTIG